MQITSLPVGKNEPSPAETRRGILVDKILRARRSDLGEGGSSKIPGKSPPEFSQRRRLHNGRTQRDERKFCY